LSGSDPASNSRSRQVTSLEWIQGISELGIRQRGIEPVKSQEMHNRNRAFIRSVAASFAVFCAAGVFAALGCKSLPPSKPESEWTPQEARGAAVYRAHCQRCHYPTTTRGLNGPGLQAITKVKAMPSGAPPTDERMANVIIHGRNMMPGTLVSDEQMQDLLAYLHTL